MDVPPGLGREGTASSPRGRSLKATRSFEPGEIIAQFATPSLVLPDSPSLHITCSYCLRTDLDVRACTGCRGTYYCSTPCQKSDWSLVHKAECNVFKRVKAEGHDFLPTPVRSLVQMLLRAELKAAAAEMEGHLEAHRNNRSEWKDMELQALASLHYLEREATPKRVGEALELLCKVCDASARPTWTVKHGILIPKPSCKSIRSAERMKILGRREYLLTQRCQWSTIRAYQILTSNLVVGRQCCGPVLQSRRARRSRFRTLVCILPRLCLAVMY